MEGISPIEWPPKRCLIVAELSANHGGSLERAMETLEAAKEAGADAAKLQTYRADTLTLPSDHPAFKIEGGLWDGRHLYSLYEEAHTPWEWHEPLFRRARELELPIFSTPFDASAVELLDGLGVQLHKIASFELYDLELVRVVARSNKPIILSTGMATLVEIGRAVETIREEWGGRDHGLALLRCVSAYPAAPRDMNLKTISALGPLFGVIPGLSDHTLGTAVATTSIAFGAKIIEKHFTLSRADGGPDAAFSLEPAELRRLVADVRIAEEAIGEIRFGPSEGDEASARFKRSILIVKDIEEGAAFTEENIRILRPGAGLPPHLYRAILGRRASRALKGGTPLLAEDIADFELGST